VERLRSRLQVLTSERLGMTAHGEARLVDNLARIERLLFQTRAAPVSTEERVLYQGSFVYLELHLTGFLVLNLLSHSVRSFLVAVLLFLGWMRLIFLAGSPELWPGALWTWRPPSWREPLSRLPRTRPLTV
jgi:hypothetical protein